MGKKTLLTGVIAGAVVGGLVSLFNKDAREYAKASLDKSVDQLTYYAQHPTEAVNNVQTTMRSLNDTIEDNLDGAYATLEQVENTVHKFIK